MITLDKAKSRYQKTLERRAKREEEVKRILNETAHMELIRYDNRKMYWVNMGRYVNMTDIISVLKRGASIRAIRADDKFDITDSVVRYAFANYVKKLSKEDILSLLNK